MHYQVFKRASDWDWEQLDPSSPKFSRTTGNVTCKGTRKVDHLDCNSTVSAPLRNLKNASDDKKHNIEISAGRVGLLSGALLTTRTSTGHDSILNLKKIVLSSHASRNDSDKHISWHLGTTALIFQ